MNKKSVFARCLRQRPYLSSLAPLLSFSLSLSLTPFLSPFHTLSFSLSRSRARISVLLAFHLELAIPSRFVNGFIYNYRASRSRITLDKYHRKGEGYENPRPNETNRARLQQRAAKPLARRSRPHPPSSLLPPSSCFIHHHQQQQSSSRRPTDRPDSTTYVRFSIS